MLCECVWLCVSVYVHMCKLMSIPDGITWAGHNKKIREIKNVFDLNFKLCKNIIFARSVVLAVFPTHTFLPTHANTMDAMLYLCLVMHSTLASYTKQNSLKMICRVPHKWRAKNKPSRKIKTTIVKQRKQQQIQQNKRHSKRIRKR